MTKDGKEQAVSQGAGAPRSLRPTLPSNASPVTAPTDPGLEAFCRLIGHLAAEAVLRDLGANLELPPVSIETPRGIDRTPPPRRRKKAR